MSAGLNDCPLPPEQEERSGNKKERNPAFIFILLKFLSRWLFSVKIFFDVMIWRFDFVEAILGSECTDHNTDILVYAECIPDTVVAWFGSDERRILLLSSTTRILFISSPLQFPFSSCITAAEPGRTELHLINMVCSYPFQSFHAIQPAYFLSTNGH